MAKINISKRLRKSTYAASEDEVSLSDATSRDFDDSDVDPEYQYQLPAKRARRSNLRETSVMSSGSDSSAMPAARKPTRVPDPKCTNRNALLARENRKRKKEEKDKMENQIEELLQAKKIFAEKCKRLKANEAKMAEEIRYLKSVIENTPQISQCLRKFNIAETDTSSTAASSGYATSDTLSVTDLGKTDILNFLEDFCNQNETYFNEMVTDENLEHIELMETSTVIMNSTFFDDVTFSDNKIVDELQPTIARTPPTSARSPDHDYVLRPNYQSHVPVGFCVHTTDGKSCTINFCAECNSKATQQVCWTANLGN